MSLSDPIAVMLTRIRNAQRVSLPSVTMPSSTQKEAIAKVLRHSSVEMTAHYAKIDVALLKDVAQPWPEVNG